MSEPTKKTLKLWMKAAIVAGLILFIVATIITLFQITWQVDYGKQTYRTFQSKAEVQKYIDDGIQKCEKIKRYSWSGSISFGCSSKDGRPAAMPNTGEESGSYSQTNTQVRGIDESDIVKTNGKFIYSIEKASKESDKEGTTLLLTDTTNKTVSKMYIENVISQEMYLYGEHHLVLVGRKLEQKISEDDFYFGDYEEQPFKIGYGAIVVVDVSDAKNPTIVKSVSLEGGEINATRLKDGKLYFAATSRISYHFYHTDEKTDTAAYYLDGKRHELSYENIIALPSGYTNLNYTYLGVLDLQLLELKSLNAYFGYTQNMYMNDSALYLVASNYYYERNVFGLTSSASQTIINRFELSADGNLKYFGEAFTDGYILEQYSMDEKDGYFRIATSINNTGESANVTVYRLADGKFTLSDQITGLGAKDNERIYSVRFNGDYCYLVTARQIDPLYTLNLKDPENILQESEFKTVEIGMYMHMFNDDTLVSFGTVSDNIGVQVTLFDVSNKEETQKKHQLNLSASGKANYSPKAILVYQSDSLMYFGINISLRLNGNLVNMYTLIGTDGKSLWVVGNLNVRNVMHEYDHELRCRGVIINNELFVISPLKVAYAQIEEQLTDFTMLKFSEEI